MISEDFPWPAGIRDRLNEELNAQLSPLLKGLGFVAVHRGKKGKLPLNWYRDRGIVIDALDFQWDKYKRPSLAINFRSFDHPDDLKTCRRNPKSVNAWDFGLRAIKKPKDVWFGPSVSDSWLRSKKAVASAAELIAISINDIDLVMKGNVSTTPMYDHGNWLDSRMPDHPPPWNDATGGVASRYHLPPYRVGRGSKLGNWEI